MSEADGRETRYSDPDDVRPVRYYLQALAINSAGSLLVLLAAVLLAAALVGAAVPVGTVLAVGVGAYVLAGGVTFLASTLVRFDAPIAAAWILTGFPLVVGAENGIAFARPLSWLFPQGPSVALVRTLRVGHGVENVVLLGALVVLIAVLYGLLALAGGVAVLRRRSIST